MQNIFKEDGIDLKELNKHILTQCDLCNLKECVNRIETSPAVKKENLVNKITREYHLAYVKTRNECENIDKEIARLQARKESLEKRANAYKKISEDLKNS